MKLQQMLSQVRQALDDYHMIEQNDSIAIGLSGGKDSVALLSVMRELARFYPVPFRIAAVTVDLGFGNMDFKAMEQYCRELGVPYHVVRTEISQIVFDSHPDQNPCSLCARLRKGAFNRFALELGCNKTAFGHHRDDVVETMMMSLLFEGRFHSFAPVTQLDRSALTLIRPLLYVKEADIKGYVRRYQLPVWKNPCPVDGATNRQYVKDLLNTINREQPGVKDRMFTAVMNSLFPL